jgi:hypothetical protein
VVLHKIDKKMIQSQKLIQNAIDEINIELESIDIEYLNEQVHKFHKLNNIKEELIELLQEFNLE